MVLACSQTVIDYAIWESINNRRALVNCCAPACGRLIRCLLLMGAGQRRGSCGQEAGSCRGPKTSTEVRARRPLRWRWTKGGFASARRPRARSRCLRGKGFAARHRDDPLRRTTTMPSSSGCARLDRRERRRSVPSGGFGARPLGRRGPRGGILENRSITPRGARATTDCEATLRRARRHHRRLTWRWTEQTG